MDYLAGNVQLVIAIFELELAIKHIQSKGANLSRFNIFKGNKPL